MPVKQKRISKNGKRKWPGILIAFMFAAGIAVLLYPTFSDWYNSLHQSKAIEYYSDSVSAIDAERYETLLESAREYNEWLYETGHGLGLDESELEEYEKQLQVSDSGVIGSIQIDKIDVSLPIYLGTSDSVLSSGVGHLEGSSLPVGGENTHCILSAHSGLISSTLFTNLDQLDIGDTFVLYVLNETLTYEVDQILVVEPEDVSALQIIEGGDYCTLLTCTPYGINSHRLLVRGKRIENLQVQTASAQEETPCWLLILICCILAALIVFITIILIRMRRKNGKSLSKRGDFISVPEINDTEKT